MHLPEDEIASAAEDDEDDDMPRRLTRSSLRQPSGASEAAPLEKRKRRRGGGRGRGRGRRRAQFHGSSDDEDDGDGDASVVRGSAAPRAAAAGGKRGRRHSHENDHADDGEEEAGEQEEPAGGGGVDEDDAVCDICRDGEWDDDAQILICDGNCGKAVHTTCYGVLNIPDGDWLCDSCKLKHSGPCELCDRSGGIMRRFTKGPIAGEWAHMTCALAFEQSSFDNTARMDGLALSSDVSRLEATKRFMCSLCASKAGFKTRCAAAGCRQYLHPVCAADAGLRFELRAYGEASKVYCDAHQGMWPTSDVGFRNDGFRWREVLGLLDGLGTCNRKRPGEEFPLQAEEDAAMTSVSSSSSAAAGGAQAAVTGGGGNWQMYKGRLINCATVGKVKGPDGQPLRRAILPPDLQQQPGGSAAAGAGAGDDGTDRKVQGGGRDAFSDGPLAAVAAASTARSVFSRHEALMSALRKQQDAAAGLPAFVSHNPRYQRLLELVPSIGTTLSEGAAAEPDVETEPLDGYGSKYLYGRQQPGIWRYANKWFAQSQPAAEAAQAAVASSRIHGVGDSQQGSLGASQPTSSGAQQYLQQQQQPAASSACVAASTLGADTNIQIGSEDAVDVPGGATMASSPRSVSVPSPPTHPASKDDGDADDASDRRSSGTRTESSDGEGGTDDDDEDAGTDAGQDEAGSEDSDFEADKVTQREAAAAAAGRTSARAAAGRRRGRGRRRGTGSRRGIDSNSKAPPKLRRESSRRSSGVVSGSGRGRGRGRRRSLSPSSPSLSPDASPAREPSNNNNRRSGAKRGAPSASAAAADSDDDDEVQQMPAAKRTRRSVQAQAGDNNIVSDIESEEPESAKPSRKGKPGRRKSTLAASDASADVTAAGATSAGNNKRFFLMHSATASFDVRIDTAALGSSDSSLLQLSSTTGTVDFRATDSVAAGCGVPPVSHAPLTSVGLAYADPTAVLQSQAADGAPSSRQVLKLTSGLKGWVTSDVLHVDWLLVDSDEEAELDAVAACTLKGGKGDLEAIARSSGAASMAAPPLLQPSPTGAGSSSGFNSSSRSASSSNSPDVSDEVEMELWAAEMALKRLEAGGGGAGCATARRRWAAHGGSYETALASSVYEARREMEHLVYVRLYALLYGPCSQCADGSAMGLGEAPPQKQHLHTRWDDLCFHRCDNLQRLHAALQQTLSSANPASLAPSAAEDCSDAIGAAASSSSSAGASNSSSSSSALVSAAALPPAPQSASQLAARHIPWLQRWALSFDCNDVFSFPPHVAKIGAALLAVFMPHVLASKPPPPQPRVSALLSAAASKRAAAAAAAAAGGGAHRAGGSQRTAQAAASSSQANAYFNRRLAWLEAIRRQGVAQLPGAIAAYCACGASVGAGAEDTARAILPLLAKRTSYSLHPAASAASHFGRPAPTHAHWLAGSFSIDGLSSGAPTVMSDGTLLAAAADPALSLRIPLAHPLGVPPAMVLSREAVYSRLQPLAQAPHLVWSLSASDQQHLAQARFLRVNHLCNFLMAGATPAAAAAASAAAVGSLVSPTTGAALLAASSGSTSLGSGMTPQAIGAAVAAASTSATAASEVKRAREIVSAVINCVEYLLMRVESAHVQEQASGGKTTAAQALAAVPIKAPPPAPAPVPPPVPVPAPLAPAAALSSSAAAAAAAAAAPARPAAAAAAKPKPPSPAAPSSSIPPPSFVDPNAVALTDGTKRELELKRVEAIARALTASMPELELPPPSASDVVADVNNGVSYATLALVDQRVRDLQSMLQDRRADVLGRDDYPDAAAERAEALRSNQKNARYSPVYDQQTGKEVFCVEREPHDDARMYIQCDACSDWQHIECAGVSAFQAAFWIISFSCERCWEKHKRVSYVRAPYDPGEQGRGVQFF